MRSVPPGGPDAPDEEPSVPLSAAHYDSFVVRILSRGAASGVVQGLVTHVATRRTLRFTDPQRVISFLLMHIARRGTDDARDGPPLSGK